MIPTLSNGFRSERLRWRKPIHGMVMLVSKKAVPTSASGKETREMRKISTRNKTRHVFEEKIARILGEKAGSFLVVPVVVLCAGGNNDVILHMSI